MKKFAVEFEITFYDESSGEAYTRALSLLEGLIAKHKAIGVADYFKTVPNGGIDGSEPGELEWRCIFSIREAE